MQAGALESLPLADASVDAACLTLVLHHVSDPGAVLAEAARIVKPGGRLLLTDMLPHDREEYRQQMGHVWLGFSDKQMARYAAAAGLSGLRVVPLGSNPRPRAPASSSRSPPDRMPRPGVRRTARRPSPILSLDPLRHRRSVS